MKTSLLAVAALSSLCLMAGCGQSDKPARSSDNTVNPVSSTSEDAVALARELSERHAKDGKYPVGRDSVERLISGGEVQPLLAGDRVHTYFALTRQPGFLLCMVNDETRDWAFYDSTSATPVREGNAGPGDEATFDTYCSGAS